MRIPCSCCGERDCHEFSYLGDATLQRPDDGGAEPTQAWTDYVYQRKNPAGPHRELWFHAAGCRLWLVVERDTTTHQIFSARAVNE